MARRLGRQDSATRAALMDAVEAVMLRDGYAALSARSVAREAGLNYQLVFYYFEKIDNLFLSTYRRRTKFLIERLERALESERPLHDLWEAASNPSEAALSLEYMAMSNHNPLIREETILHARLIFQAVSKAMSVRLTKNVPDREVFTPTAIGMLVTAIGQNLGFQSALGIAGALHETRALVEWAIDQLEPPAQE